MENTKIAVFDVSAIQAEQKNNLEDLVLQGLILVRRAVAMASPDQTTIHADFTEAQYFDHTGWVIEETARRIQALSPGWRVTPCTLSGQMIGLERTPTSAEQTAEIVNGAGGFDVSTILIESRAALEPLVLEGLEEVRKAVAENVHNDREIYVPLFGEKRVAPNSWVIEEIARRIQQLSPDWMVKAYTMAGQMIGLQRKPNATEPPAADAGGFDVSAALQQRLVDNEPAIAAAVEAVRHHLSRMSHEPENFELEFPGGRFTGYVLRQAALRIQACSPEWKVSAFHFSILGDRKR
jgi:hypothetical protein